MLSAARRFGNSALVETAIWAKALSTLASITGTGLSIGTAIVGTPLFA
jgi:hypothetical protein